MHVIPFAAACTLVIVAMGGVSAEEPKAATAGGSGQSQAAPSAEANPPVVVTPPEAKTAAGSGQNQAAPSSEAMAPGSIEPAVGAAGQGAAGSGCPAGQVMGASGGCAPNRAN